MCWGFIPKKIMEDTGFTEYPVDYRPPFLPLNPEVPRSFRQGAPGHTRRLHASRERALGHTVPVRTTGYGNYANTYSVHCLTIEAAMPLTPGERLTAVP
jgi:hypothetical protein